MSKKKKGNQQAWKVETIYLNKEIPQIEDFNLELESLGNDIVKVIIKNTSKKAIDFSFDSYALSNKGRKREYECQAGQTKTLKLRLGSYFDISYR